MDHRVLTVFLSLCSSGILAANSSTDPSGLRLTGGAGRCDGELEMMKDLTWTPVYTLDTHLKFANRVCADLDCGSAVSIATKRSPEKTAGFIGLDCEEPELRDCLDLSRNDWSSVLELKCSDSVRLLHGPSLCSGSLEVHWDQSWTSVCEEDFDLQDAEVVCRELGCGAPSLLQGALYGEGRAPLGQTFQCEGHESALMDCTRSSSGDTCSSGKAVDLTCSDPGGVRLVGQSSRCAGTVEVRHRGQWRRLTTWSWDQETTAVVCRELECGSVVSGERRRGLPFTPVWDVSPACLRRTFPLSECVLQTDTSSSDSLEVVCSDLLTRPNISLRVSADGVSQAQPQGLRVLLGSDFSVSCSVQPQFPGGSFQLISPTVDPAQNHTLPAVNHSAHFLFSDAGSAHRGGYTCVYHLHVFSHNFSSQSQTLYLTLGARDSELILKVALILLLKLIYIPALYFYCKSTRGQQQQGRRAAAVKRRRSQSSFTDLDLVRI